MYGISPKLLSVDSTPGPSTIVLIADGVVSRGVAVPPLLPGMVLPLLVSGGWTGSVTV